MWLFTPDGFYSVVAPDPRDPYFKEIGLKDDLVVRARSIADLADLRDRWLPELSATVVTHNRDYLCRAFCQPDDLAAAMGRIVRALDYGNFKDEVKRRQGPIRARIYGNVWFDVLQIQTLRDRRRDPLPGALSEPFPPDDIAEIYPELFTEGDMG